MPAHIKPEAGAKDMVTEDEIEGLKQVYEEARERKAHNSSKLTNFSFFINQSKSNDIRGLSSYEAP